MVFDVISSRRALSGPGNDGQRFTHLQFINYTDIRRTGSGLGMTIIWKKTVDEPDAFPLLPSSLTALREWFGRLWRRLIAAGIMRQWWPRLKEVNREVRKKGVAVPGGVEHLGLRPRALHDMGNWLVLTDCSNAVNTVNSTVVLQEVGTHVQALTPFVAKCYGARPADVLSWMDSRETRAIACSGGVQQGDPMGPSMFCLSLRPGLKRSREDVE